MIPTDQKEQQMQKITADLSELPTPFADGTPAQRVETGALQINDDWPGIYIRGDNALFYAMQLSRMLDQVQKLDEIIDIIGVSSLKGLVDTLRSCAIVHAEDEKRQLDLDLATDGVGC
jgi:hypothetical protein